MPLSPVPLAYLTGRQPYRRPEALLFADSPPTVDANGFYVPYGVEGVNFIVVSDHNRKPIDFKTQRIEKRERTVNGRMRSYHVADKMTISTSWDNLPSRAFGTDPAFNTSTGATSAKPWTVDGGAGGGELLEWYENHTGSFWVFLAYDKHNNFSTSEYSHMNQYNQVIEMFISDFSYTVNKRGAATYDLWNVSLSLEEV